MLQRPACNQNATPQLLWMYPERHRLLPANMSLPTIINHPNRDNIMEDPISFLVGKACSIDVKLWNPWLKRSALVADARMNPQYFNPRRAISQS
jgi:hypothetical protein